MVRSADELRVHRRLDQGQAHRDRASFQDSVPLSAEVGCLLPATALQSALVSNTYGMVLS